MNSELLGYWKSNLNRQSAGTIFGVAGYTKNPTQWSETFVNLCFSGWSQRKIQWFYKYSTALCQLLLRLLRRKAHRPRTSVSTWPAMIMHILLKEYIIVRGDSFIFPTQNYQWSLIKGLTEQLSQFHDNIQHLLTLARNT